MIAGVGHPGYARPLLIVRTSGKDLMRHACSLGAIALGVLLLSVTACGSKPAPAVATTTSSTDLPARAPSAPPAPNGPEAQKAAIEHAIAFAQSKYSGKLNFSDPVAVFEPAPPASTATTAPPPMPPRGSSNPSLAPSPPPTAAELEAMGLKPPTGYDPAKAPPPVGGLAPPVQPAPRTDPKSYWRVMFRLIAPASSDSGTPPMTTRVFAVYPSGKVVELEPLSIPVNVRIGVHPPTP